MQAAAQGTHVILPTADPEAPVFPARRFAWPAGAAVLVGVGAMMLLQVTEAGAGSSSLEFSPATPQRGDIIEVTYRPGERFAGRDRLVLRGRLREANKLLLDLMVTPRPITVLTKRGRGFRDSFVLPDSVVFGAFAVEDEMAEEVDSDGGRLWDLLTDEYAALAQLRNDLSGRDWGRPYRVAREATQRYPDSPDAWTVRGGVEVLFDGDSVRARHAVQYDVLNGRQHTTREDVAGMYWYALTVVGDAVEADSWSGRLRELDPGHPYLARPRPQPSRDIRSLMETMTEHTDGPVFATNRAVPDLPALGAMLSDRVTVIAQWTRFTLDAQEILRRLELLHVDLEQAGADIVLVTRDDTDPPTNSVFPVVRVPVLKGS